MKRVLRVNERVHVFINPEGNDGEGKIDSRIFQKKDGRLDIHEEKEIFSG